MTLHDQNLAETSLWANPERKGLKVRLLEKDDRPAVREIIKQHHASTVFRDQEFSVWKLNEHFNLILSRPPRMVRAGSGNLNSSDKWNFCLTSA
ncbi:hypothetical protein [Agrobacterium salinitolerans]|uniref:hypothetical protein n=1 Tax=Agrobacterium salinitolerans TaxID=1183413 RepID=UPI001877E526|nr:hypothetical protein [Agrobacterium salinitolerans]